MSDKFLITNYGKNVFECLGEDYKIFDRENTSFIKQLSKVEDLTHINCNEYDLPFSVLLIEWCLECSNSGLTDSIKYYFYLIEYCILNNLNHFFVYNKLNFLLNCKMDI